MFKSKYTNWCGHTKNNSFDPLIDDYVYSHYKYFKPIHIASGQDSYLEKLAEKEAPGIVCATNNNDFAQQFLENIAQKRFWERM